MQLDLELFKHSFHLASGTVIHAGASYCQEASIYQKSGFEPVYWIEALGDVAEKGAKNLEKFPNQKIYCETLYSVDGHQIYFNRTSNEAQSSSILDLGLHSVVHQSVTLESREIHNTITLKSFIGKHLPKGNLALLVLDLQGGELETLKGLGTEFFRINAIFTEVSNYKMYRHQPLFRDVHKYLSSLGFVLIAHDMGNETFMGDALYVHEHHANLYNLDSLSVPIIHFNLTFLLQRFRYKLISMGIPETLLRFFSKRMRKFRGTL